MAQDGTTLQEGNKERLWTATFSIFLVMSLCNAMIGNGLHNGIAILVEAAHAPAALTGSAAAAFSFTALAMRFVGGTVSDYLGRKKIIVVGAAIMVAANVLSMLSGNIYMLIPLRVMMGVGFALAGTAATAATADIIPPSRMGEGMGYQGLALALSMALGPSLAIILAERGGQVWMFGAYAILALVVFIAPFFCKFKAVAPREKKRGQGQDQGLERTQEQAQTQAQTQDGTPAKGRVLRVLDTLFAKEAVAPSIVVIVFDFALAIYMIYIALFAVTYDLMGSTVFFVLSAAVMIFIRTFFSKYFDILSATTLIVPTFIFGILGYLAVLLFKSTAAMIFAGVCYGIMDGVGGTVLMAEPLRRAPEDRKGAASTTYYVCCDIGIGASSIVWGIVIDHLGFTGAFIGGILVSVLGIIISFFLLREKKQVQS